MSSELSKLCSLVEDGYNVLLHGPGGVGKSWLIDKFRSRYKHEKPSKVVVLTATTGIAALNIGGITLHRFAGVKTGDADVDVLIKHIAIDKKTVDKWKTIDILIIDEVSMLGETFLGKLDKIAKHIRKNKNPMGGIQMIFSGDFLQLPPVKDLYVFGGDVWKSLNIKPVVLAEPKRYPDIEFFELLMRARKGILTEQDCNIIKKRVRCHKKLSNVLQNLKDENPGDVIKPTLFFSRKKHVELHNENELKKLNSKEHEFKCIDEFIKKENFTESVNTESRHFKLLDENFPRIIKLKVGAQVMITANINPEEGLVNGTRGVVHAINSDLSVDVLFLNGSITTIEYYDREVDDDYGYASRKQLPVMLAFAQTIHKAQGCTLDYAVVDLGPTVFAEGQAYVALSRCRTFKGLFISEFLPGVFKVNKDALNYVNTLEDVYN